MDWIQYFKSVKLYLRVFCCVWTGNCSIVPDKHTVKGFSHCFYEKKHLCLQDELGQVIVVHLSQVGFSLINNHARSIQHIQHMINTSGGVRGAPYKWSHNHRVCHTRPSNSKHFNIAIFGQMDVDDLCLGWCARVYACTYLCFLLLLFFISNSLETLCSYNESLPLFCTC